MLDVFAGRFDLVEHSGMFLREKTSQVQQIGGQSAAFFIGGEERGQIVLVLGHHLGGFTEVGNFGFLQSLRDKGGRDIQAVEHVADIMQHAAGYFGHAGLAAGIFQLTMHPLSLALGALAIGDIQNRPVDARRVA